MTAAGSTTFRLRDFQHDDAAAVNRVALAAFGEYRDAFSDWPAFARTIGNMAGLAQTNEIIVATVAERVVAAVGYVGPHQPKAAHFKPEWPLIRMLSVDPGFRGGLLLITRGVVDLGVASGQASVKRAVEGGAKECRDVMGRRTPPFVYITHVNLPPLVV